MRKVGQLCKSLDVFGKPLFLNFDKQWNTHDTKFGGITTFTLFIFILIYTAICFNIMQNYSQDTMKTIVNEIN